MTLLEAIQLVQHRSAADISAGELAELREVLQQHPSLAAAVGGRERLNSFLTAAELAMTARAAAGQPEPTPEPAVAAVQPRLAEPALRRPRRTLELSIYGGLVALVAGVLYWQLAPFMRRETKADKNETVAAVQASDNAPPAAKSGQSKPLPTVARKQAADRGLTDEGAPAKDTAEPAEPEPHVWRDWQVEKREKARTEFQAVWDLTDPSMPEPVKLLIVSSGPVTLSREIDIPDDAKMLAVDTRQLLPLPADAPYHVAPKAPGTIKLLVDGQQTAASAVPAPDYPGSLLLSLGGAHGRRAKLTLAYQPADPQERVIWRSFGFSKAPSDVLLASGEPEPRNRHLRLWLRADSGIRDAAGRGPNEPGFDGAVQSWEDRSTGGRHVTSDTGDPMRRPAYVSAAAAISSRPAVAFDGRGAFLRYSVGGVYVGGPSTTMAVFFLTHMHSTKDTRRSCVVFDTAPSALKLWINNGARVKNGHTVAFGPLSVSSSGQVHGQFVIATAVANGPTSLLDINGGLRTPGAMENVKSESNFVIGLPAGVPPNFGGYPTQVAELMIYDRALSDVECRQIGQYLSRRYGTAGAY